MVNPHDVYKSYTGLSIEEQIIDSYELFTRLIVDLKGQGNFYFTLDNILPFIKGDMNFIEGVFKGFLLQAMNEFEGKIECVKIVQINDPKAWIFSFTTLDSTFSAHEKETENLKNRMQEFKLVISKKVFMEIKCISPE